MVALAHVNAAEYGMARQWFESSAAAGESRAKLNLGWLHEEGLLGSVNGAEAIRWYTRGVQAGESAYAIKLAWIHLQGQLVAPDLLVAEGWFHHAINAGHTEANLGLGSVVLSEVIGGAFGRIDEAIELFEMALEGGLPMANHFLGRVYREGLGVPVDNVRALGYFQTGAEAGLPELQWRLGEMYASGLGTDRDPVLAGKWTYLAVANGVDQARGLLSELEAEFDSEQRAQARRLAVEAATASATLD